MTVKRLLNPSWGLVLAVGLSACGGAGDPTTTASPSNLSGQVTATSTAASPVTHYAASRFLEQSTMGPSPDSVARVRTLGVAGWIDEQLKKPATLINTPSELINFDRDANPALVDRVRWSHTNSIIDMAIGADHELRYRVAWVLSNFLVTSSAKVEHYGLSEYWNTLMKGAFGQYGDLLKAITLSPAMGHYLDNASNRKDSLNENYGRELMQLFSVGMVMLNPDGSPRRDSAGKTIETYSQKDVIEITRALTGWIFAPHNLPQPIRNNYNFANFGVPMEAARWTGAHDTDAKTVLGKTIPAGGDAAKDLDAVINVLMTHPNTAPFVVWRLIQGLTTSEPSPAYVRRMTTVWDQTRGNLGAVVKAILLDPEARMGDLPGKGTVNFGRIREPFLVHTTVLRAMGCRRSTRDRNNPGNVDLWSDQVPLTADTVFGFYPPTHRAPGSKLLAPEQKMLISREFKQRAGRYHWQWEMESVLSGAGCEVDVFKKAIAQSDDALLDLLSERLFRGAMPATVRQGLKDSLATQQWERNSPTRMLGFMVQFATMTPALGAIK